MGLTYAEAIGQATVDAMEKDPSIVLLGSGVTDFKGVFGTTLEAARRFPDRVFDVPNSEAALGGIVCGLASQGYHPLWVHHRIDFMTYCVDPIVNLLAKWATMYQADPLPVTIRTIVGRGWGQGPTHSQFLGSTFAHFPGLRVAAPDDAYEAGELLRDALFYDAPWLLVEHRALYPLDLASPLPYDGTGREPQVTVATCSAGVREAAEALRLLWCKYDIRIDVVPVRHLRPLGIQGVLTSLETTHRLVVLDPGWETYGFSAEVVACAVECDLLEEPPIRVAPPAVPAPTAAPLETAYWPGAEAVVQAVLRMLGRAADSDPGPALPGAHPNAFTGPY